MVGINSLDLLARLWKVISISTILKTDGFLNNLLKRIGLIPLYLRNMWIVLIHSKKPKTGNGFTIPVTFLVVLGLFSTSVDLIGKASSSLCMLENMTTFLIWWIGLFVVSVPFLMYLVKLSVVIRKKSSSDTSKIFFSIKAMMSFWKESSCM